MPLFMNIRNAAVIDFKGNEYDKYKPERWYVEGDGYTPLDRMANKAKEEGYEGMVIKSVKDGTNYPIDEYIAFSPTQVKSATENNRNFDPNDPDIRFRKSKPRGSAAQDYNRAVRTPNKGKTVKGRDNLAYRVGEAYQNSMLALDKLKKAVANETGTEIRDFENAYIAENRMSSMNKSEPEVFNRDLMKPLYKEVFDLMHDATGCTNDEVDRYLKAKHGLERNEYFREKLANEMGEKAAEEARKKLAEEGKGEEEIEEGGEAARRETHDKVLKKLQKSDFSGLTELTEVEGEKNTEFTKRAEAIVDDFENRHDVKPLWKAIHAATDEGLKKSLKSGVISKKVYDQIKGMFEYYVPLRGWDKNEAGKEYDYFGNGMSHEQHVWLHSWCQRCGW